MFVVTINGFGVYCVIVVGRAYMDDYPLSWVVEQTFYISISCALWGARHDQYCLHSRVLCRSLHQPSDNFLRAFF